MAERKGPSLGTVLLVGASIGVCGLGCLGIGASMAIPAFVQYTHRARTLEAGANLREMYQASAAYYMNEGATLSGEVSSWCTVGSARTPNTPGPSSTLVDTSTVPELAAIGFSLPDPVAYQYAIVAGPSRCGHGPNEDLYSFDAIGDLDGNGTQSLFEYAAGSDEHNEMYRTPGLYIQNELE